ncbi:MAG: 3-deoxy-7-phosphoheptulonate synthase [SAR202 cluster bacterium Io17-Chloro-G3]|nr:MAG: 3-deoxy-7-phosphoheptulonate synthase [SAR202 cluster bacterium Io17-Chloro-G3]
MIVVMQVDSTEKDIELIQNHLTSKGLEGQVNRGVERTVIGVMGQIFPELLNELEVLPGVREVVPVSRPYKLSSREFQPNPTTIQVGPVTIGGEDMVIMAGPCSVESAEQIMDTARIVKSVGGKILRGGAFKPRSSPYSFRGLGEEGLKYLVAAREETGLPIITEVMDTRDVELVSRYADILQIGARNMQNFNLLDEVGQSGKPTMLKRAFSATYEDWLLAAEYVLAKGNKQLMLCERGIRTFENYTRNTLDITAIPVIKRLSHLPIISDPSHGTGKWHLVIPAALASVAAGAHGLIVEVHPNPDKALSDGAQSLNFENFRKLAALVTAVKKATEEVPNAL